MWEEGWLIQMLPAKPSKQFEPLLTTLLFFMSHSALFGNNKEGRERGERPSPPRSRKAV